MILEPPAPSDRVADFLWTPARTTGLEHLRVQQSAHGLWLDGLRHRLAPVPRLRYRVAADADGTVRFLRFDILAADLPPPCWWFRNADGLWIDGRSAEPRPDLEDCHDFLLGPSPLGDSPAGPSLAARRLGLASGERRMAAALFLEMDRFTGTGLNGEGDREADPSPSCRCRLVRREIQWQRLSHDRLCWSDPAAGTSCRILRLDPEGWGSQIKADAVMVTRMFRFPSF